MFKQRTCKKYMVAIQVAFRYNNKPVQKIVQAQSQCILRQM
jgi:hypothetical protein